MFRTPIYQSADHIWMTVSVAFHANSQTMATNSYQSADPADIGAVQKAARAEFLNFRDTLVGAGIAVTTTLGAPDSPDDIFPNWASAHVLENGEHVIVYYPMLNENRRIERRPFMKEILERGYKVHLDMSAAEKDNKALESTSALWMDRIHKVAYSTLSARSDTELAQKWCALMGYSYVPLHTRNHVGKPVYHTDVMMFTGTDFVGICLECILPDAACAYGKISKKRGARLSRLPTNNCTNFVAMPWKSAPVTGQKLVMSGSLSRLPQRLKGRLPTSCIGDHLRRPPHHPEICRRRRKVHDDGIVLEVPNRPPSAIRGRRNSQCPRFRFGGDIGTKGGRNQYAVTLKVCIIFIPL